MVSGAARRIKLSVNMRPFVSRVVRAGWVQRAFTVQIGRPVGGCVRTGVRAGMSGAEIHKVAKECARQAIGVRLTRQAPAARIPAADSIRIPEAHDLNVLDSIDFDLENII